MLLRGRSGLSGLLVALPFACNGERAEPNSRAEKTKRSAQQIGSLGCALEANRISTKAGSFVQVRGCYPIARLELSRCVNRDISSPRPDAKAISLRPRLRSGKTLEERFKSFRLSGYQSHLEHCACAIRVPLIALLPKILRRMLLAAEKTA